MVRDKRPRLQGKVLEIERTGEKITDEDGNEWEKCVFTVELTRFSKRTPDREVPYELSGEKVKLIRYCCFDWHYKLGIIRTLDSGETEAVLSRASTSTVY